MDEHNLYEKYTRHVLKLGGAVGITIPSTIAKKLDLKPNEGGFSNLQIE